MESPDCNVFLFDVNKARMFGFSTLRCRVFRKTVPVGGSERWGTSLGLRVTFKCSLLVCLFSCVHRLWLLIYDWYDCCCWLLDCLFAGFCDAGIVDCLLCVLWYQCVILMLMVAGVLYNLYWLVVLLFTHYAYSLCWHHPSPAPVPPFSRSRFLYRTLHMNLPGKWPVAFQWPE